MNIAQRLDKAMRDARFPSQSALARASGIPQPTINRILKGAGARGPETNTLVKLAEACNVRFEWLSSGVGPASRTAEDAQHQAPALSVAEATPARRMLRGDLAKLEPLVALGVLSEREAQLVSWFRMATESGRTVIESAAMAVKKSQLSAVVDDQPQDGLARTGDSNCK